MNTGLVNRVTGDLHYFTLTSIGQAVTSEQTVKAKHNNDDLKLSPLDEGSGDESDF